MRSKVTLVLIFLNVALFFVIFQFERSWRTESVAREVRRRVLGAEAADIRALEVTSVAPGGGFSLERRGEGWILTRPVEWRANPNAVSRIINDLQFLEHETSFAVRDVVKNGQSLADYGLEHPKFTVSFTSGGPDTTGAAPMKTTLRIGDATKVGQRIYVLSSDGARIHVVGRELVDGLSMPLEQLRADTVLTIPVFEARAVNLQTSPPAGVLVVIQRDGSRWWFETPIPARANKDAIELAINGLDSLRLREFVAAPPSAPDLRVTLVGNNRQETLYLGAEAPSARSPKAAPAADKVYYAQLEDQSKPLGRSACFTVAVADSLLGTLRRAQESLRDRHVLDLDPAAVTMITLRAPNQPELTLQRLESGTARTQPDWQIILRGDAAQGPSTLPADRAAVQRLLDQLTLLSAEQFKSDAPQELDLEHWGFMSPERTVVLTQPPLAAPRAAGGGPAAPSASHQTLEIGRSTQREPYVYARLRDALSVYTVSPDILRELPLTPAAWRDRQLPALPAAAKISGLKLTDLKTGATVWEWAATAPGGKGAAAAEVLADQVRGPHAKRFVSEAFAPVPGWPWRYRLDASIALPAGPGGEHAGGRTLWLAERSGGDEQYAGSAEFGAVFAIEQTFIDALWKLTYGERDPGPPSPPAPAAPNR